VPAYYGTDVVKFSDGLILENAFLSILSINALEIEIFFNDYNIEFTNYE
jgi:hypothetical protein